MIPRFQLNAGNQSYHAIQARYNRLVRLGRMRVVFFRELWQAFDRNDKQESNGTGEPRVTEKFSQKFLPSPSFSPSGWVHPNGAHTTAKRMATAMVAGFSGADSITALLPPSA
jgi:hypothetical protein